MDKDIWEEALTRIINFHGPFRHDNEVAWSLWAALRLELKLSRAAVDVLSKMDDPIVVLQALHAESSGLCESPLNKDHWESLMTGESLSDENWLLAYEARSHGWLGQSGNDFVEADPEFKFLRGLDVRFYAPERVKGAPTGVAPSFGLAPMFY